MNPAAFKATYSDFKIIKGRKCAQLILEVPIEAANAAMEALGGVPRADQEVWVAVARLDAPKAANAPSIDSNDFVKGRRKFNTLPASQQASMRCNEPAFQRFMGERNAVAFENMGPEYAAKFVRETCGVESRAEIKHGTPAGLNWAKLNDQFLGWLQVDA